MIFENEGAQKTGARVLIKVNKQSNYENVNPEMEIQHPYYTRNARLLEPEKKYLFRMLRGLRGEFARRENVPAYIIFSDATLLNICRKMPRTYAELLEVDGMAHIKCVRYGAEILGLLKLYAAGND